jgi:hypothetical protein
MAPPFQFGAGSLWGYPVAGNTATNPTPIEFGTVQDVSIDISGDVKQLYGQKQFPEAIARGKTKITGKAKFARINGKLWNDVFFGQTLAAGMIKVINDESHVIPATPFQVTIAPPSGAYLNDATRGDLGVRNSSTGAPFTKVANSPTAGQYSVTVATGVYLFASADNVSGITALISYAYTPTATGVQLNITNQLMGFAPTVQIVLQMVYNGNEVDVVLYNCLVSKLSFATKQEDFIIPEMDFEAFANSAGKVMDIFASE